MTMLELINENSSWTAPTLIENITHGDMPGDKVKIESGHVEKASVIFPVLLENMKVLLENKKEDKLVISVCGGSGVGKSETASLLSYYLTSMGIDSYTMSGDNYPHRIPMYNDAERLRIFRINGIEKMLVDGVYTKERANIINELQEKNDDANVTYCQKYDWYSSYIEGGRSGLEGYLGTTNETNFDSVNEIIEQFKDGKEKIWLKRMGRTESELWFEEIDFSDISVLVVEWTHGNNDNLVGVDIPVLLNSTPEETLAHRRMRNRDGGVDSPFIMTVLDIEQRLLEKQAEKAKIIVAKSGELLSYQELCDRNNAKAV
ncbi:MAG: adenylylsulfate kinase [Eubacteriales bacterium]